jgi:hypothetical protein
LRPRPDFTRLTSPRVFSQVSSARHKRAIPRHVEIRSIRPGVLAHSRVMDRR